jgi:hypothetical protein
MTEQVPQPETSPETGPEVEDGHEDGDGPESVGDERDSRTGVPAVDDVLAEVDGLDDRPLEEHLATFERAHERLRAALDADPGDGADPAGSGDPA